MQNMSACCPLQRTISRQGALQCAHIVLHALKTDQFLKQLLPLLTPSSRVLGAESCASLQEVQRTVGSALAQATVLEQQACLRPLSPDGTPVLGALPGTEGAFIATGAAPSPLLPDSCCSQAS